MSSAVTTGRPVAAGLTRELVQGLLRLDPTSLPAALGDEVRRTLLNSLGTAVGASGNPAVAIAMRHGLDHGGRPIAPVPGRKELVDLHHAALATGIAIHVDDFDDTHLETVVHPAGPVVAAALPLAATRGVGGATLLRAVLLGCEAELRVGAAISPWHYDAGWHITGTVGVLGAAFGAGIVLGLDEEQMATALGIAASSTVGMREAFGSMTKAFHVGRAAANGIMAALLAEAGLTGPTDVLEKNSGFLAVLTPRCAPERITDDIGEHWELLANTYKPYPCGIVCHPAIDAARAIHARLGDPAAIRSVVVHCHPLVVELTGDPTPRDGLEARFSTIHGVAVGLLDGRAGLAEYSDERVVAPDAQRLRGLTTLAVDDALARDAALVRVTLADGVLEESIVHARGSQDAPLSDADLFEKLRSLVEPVLPGRSEAIRDALLSLDSAPDVHALIAAMTPGPRAVTETTAELAAFAADTDRLPPEVEGSMRRMLLNMVSLCAGCSGHPAAATGARVVAAMETRQRAAVLGTTLRVDTQWAAFLNGISGHVEDYDDTHLATVIHPGPVVVPAALAVAEECGADVSELLAAMAVGTEVALRIGVGLGPVHFDRGWHVTGTLGVVGAAVAAARLSRLDARATAAAIGLAATQAATIRSALGTQTKAYHCGHAAESGIEAAQLVRLGFTAPARGIEGRRGMAALSTANADLDTMVAGLGQRWELLDNVEKPYACGVVSHPTLDAARSLRDRIADRGAVDAVEVVVNPVVLDVMAIEDPQTGLASKFSVYHCAAVGLLDGRGGIEEFSDRRARSPDVVALRSRVRVTTDAQMPRDATRMTVRLNDGGSEELYVDHVEPLDATRLAAKAQRLLAGVLGEGAQAGVEALTGLHGSDPVRLVVEAVTPEG